MVVEHLLASIEMISTLCILAYLNNRKFRFNIKNVLLILCDVLLLAVANEFTMEIPMVIPIYVLLFFYSGMEYGYDLRRMIINFVLTMLIMCALQALALLLISPFVVSKMYQAKEYFLINGIVLLIVIFAIGKIPIHRLSKLLQEQDWLVFAVILCVGTSMMYYVFLFKDTKTLRVPEYVIVFVMIVYVCFMTAIWKYYKNAALERSIEAKTTDIYSLAYKNMIEDIRSKQHDFDNHLSAIVSQHYICQDYESLVSRQKEYIEMTQKNNKYNKLLWAGDSVLVGFLYGKCLEAEKKDIAIDYKIHVAQIDCCVPEYQLISLVGNLLDNAMDAVEQEEKPVIRILLEQNPENLTLEVSNPYKDFDRNEIAHFFKRKYSKKGEKRGYGLYNVKKICDEYGISICCEGQEVEGRQWISFRLVIK